jgi:UDP-N-acetyl-D-galactosamine dehydrogenase
VMLQRKLTIGEARLLVLGFSFKENCSDIRNTKVLDLVKWLKEFTLDVTVYDPVVDTGEAEREYGIRILSEPPKDSFDAVVLAVNHDAIKTQLPRLLASLLRPEGFVYDIKSVLPLTDRIARL